MSAKPRDLGMTPLDDLFSTDESRAEAQLEKVVTLNPADISDFPNHPFKVKQDEAMAEMVDSVKLYGVLAPALAVSWLPASSCRRMPFRTARSFLAANCCPP